MPGPAGDDPAWFPVGLAVDVDEPSTVQSKLGQVPRYRASTDRDALGREFEGDLSGRSLVGATHNLDPSDDDCAGGGWLTWGRRAIKQTEVTVAAVAVNPLRRARAGDPHLGGNVGDRLVRQRITRRLRPSIESGAFGCVIIDSPRVSSGRDAWSEVTARTRRFRNVIEMHRAVVGTAFAGRVDSVVAHGVDYTVARVAGHRCGAPVGLYILVPGAELGPPAVAL